MFFISRFWPLKIVLLRIWDFCLILFILKENWTMTVNNKYKKRTFLAKFLFFYFMHVKILNMWLFALFLSMLVQDYPEFVIFGWFWANSKARKEVLGTPNNFLRISMRFAKVYLPFWSCLNLKLTLFHEIHRVIYSDITEFLDICDYLGALWGP